MVQFSCPLGYDLMGDSDAMCQFGEWEIGANPTCERKSLMKFQKYYWNVITKLGSIPVMNSSIIFTSKIDDLQNLIITATYKTQIADG